jgi:uncharacterized repeat protein (TIGR01451 family)
MDSPRFQALCEALLASGQQVRFHVRGLSMQPNLRDGDVVTVATAETSELHRGDIVLSRDRDGLRVHRLISANSSDELVTTGDTGLENDREPQRLLGRVIAIERDGRKTSAAGARQRILRASRVVTRRLRLAAALRFKKIGSSFAFFALLAALGLFCNVTPAAAQADLAVTSDTAAPTPVSQGGQVTYTVVVVNNGPNAATTPSVSMATPPGTTFVSAAKAAGAGTWNLASPGPGNPGTITFTRTTNMGNGSTTTFTFVVQIIPTAPTGALGQSVSITSTTADPNTLNNTATANVTVLTPDLSVTNTPGSPLVDALSTITYTQTVTNNSASAAIAATLTQTTPANTTFQSITVPAGWTCGTQPAVGGTGAITCTANGTFAAGTSATFTLVVAITAAAAPGSTIPNSVTVSETGTDPNLANNTANASVQVSSADLSMTQVASVSAVAPAGLITYTETVTNKGPTAANGAVLYQQTPPNTTFQSVTPPAGWTCGTQPIAGGTGQIICTDGAVLANGGSGTFTIVVAVGGAVAPGTVILNSADVTASTSDPVSTNNASTSSVLVESGTQADLATSMTASPTPVFISSNLTYTITVQNLGLINTADGKLVDTIPVGTTFVSSSTTQGSCSGAATVTCTFGAVNNGTTITVTVTVSTPASPGTLTNTATVSSTTGDPVAGNNSATTLTVVQPLVCASPGRDGPGNTLTGILNAYYPPANNGTVAAASTSIVLGSAAAAGAQTAISAGDLLLIIQMQDAAINSTNTGAYGDGIPGDPGFGSIALNNSGNFEFVTATNAVPVGGGTLNFLATGPTGGLLNAYTKAAYVAGTQGQRSFQVIRVPQYTSATLSSTLAAMPWNGATGGVLALDIASQLTLSGTVSVDAAGFRGGAGRSLAGAAGTLATDYITSSGTATNGSKGEGIAGTPTFVANAALTNLTNTGVEGLPNGSYARGAPGNAGGGATDARPTANDENSGGGGGGNGGAGGQGGFGWNSAGIVGGYGGAAFPSSTSALILGGGGGAGTTNNGTADPANANSAGINSSGAAGGGIVIIHAGSVTGAGTITANGQTALDVQNDGGGGGGAGGSIRVLVNSGLLAGLTVSANGGNGGHTWLIKGPETSFPLDRHGPGGGGAGGAIFLSSAPTASIVNGGAPGASTTSRDPYGATIGAPGVVNTVSTIPQTPGTQPGAECASADLAVTNSGSPNPVLPGPGPGNIITYTQNVTNNGPLDALNATFTESIPANTTFQSFNNPVGSGWTCITPAVGATGSISCTNPDVANAASTTFTLGVAVNTGVPSGTVITDVIDATSGTNDAILANNSATVQTTVGLSTTADLSITNSGTPNPVLAGSNITYTVVVKNNGAATASSVVFSEPIPANTTFVSVVPSPAAGWTCSVVAGTLSCSNPSVASGGSTTFTVILNVTAGTAAGTLITDTATVASSTTDPNPNNNSATSNIVVATAGQADLSITSSAAPNPVTSSNNITYSQLVTNNGPAVSGLATFTDTIPTGTTFVSFTPPAGWNCGATIPLVGGTGTISCTIATLALNATASFPLVVKVNSGTAPGASISNTANINVPCSAVTDPNCANNSASTIVIVASPTQADVAILKTASPEPVDQNTNITYTLQVTNNGPAVAQGVTVNDPLPAQVSFTSVSTTQGTCTYTVATTTVNCNLGSLSVGGLVIITINASATTFSSATLSTNTATVSATTGDPNLTNNTSSSTSTIAAPTAVQLVSFRAAPLPEGGVLLEWKTREEVRNLGFNVYREDSTGRRRLNPSLIAGSALVLRGGRPQHAAKTYQWIDPVASSPASAYWLEDVDLSGARISHGPAEITGPVSTQRAVAAAQLLTHLNQSLTTNTSAASAPSAQRPRLYDPEMDAALRAVPPGIERAVLDREPAVKVFVRSGGWYHITLAQLVAAGLDPRANPRTLQLFAEGLEQPLLLLSGNPSGSLSANDAIEFYGTGIDTPYSDARVYWLVQGREDGKRIPQLPASSFSGPEPASFPFTVVRQDRTTYFAALLNGEDQDNFFGAVVTSTPVDQELDVVHSAPSALPVTLDITLQGATEGQEHSVSVSFNGNLLGNITFVGQPLLKSTFTLDPTLLHDGANTVTLTALDGDNDVSVVQSIALHYAHTYDADSNWLRLQAASGSHLHIANFSNPQIRVFDITNPLAIEELTGRIQSTTTGFAIDVVAAGSSFTGRPRQLLAFSSDQLSAPSSLAFHHPSVLRERQEGAEILIITHPDFAASLAPLVRLREEQGHAVKLVTIDEIFDAFNSGERTPYAIRDFLLFTQRNWRRHPHSILLVGDASLDPRNFLGFGDFDFVPTRLVDTAALKTASDDWFTDFTQTGFPTIPIGRLPVRTTQEADLLVSKIVNYERGAFAGTWNGNALVVADQNIGDDFATTSTSIADSLGKSLAVTRIISGNLDPQNLKPQLLDSINQGQLLVDYVGHGSVEQWSFSDLLDNSDASALQNGNRLPVFLLMDCLNGFFQDVYTQSLAETLLLAPDGGAVAVWASSGFTDAAPQASMNRALIQALANNPNLPLGQAILAAKKLTGDSDVRRTWILFGDPAMRIHFAPPPAPSHPSHREGRSDRGDRPASKLLQ